MGTNPPPVRPQRCRMICIHAAGLHHVRTERQLGRSPVMWSRVRRAGIVTALALPCSLIAVQSAHAGLGGAPMTPPTGASVSSRIVQPGSSAVNAAQSVMRSASNAGYSATVSTPYTVRETALGNGTMVRESRLGRLRVRHCLARPANAGSERSARQLFPAVRGRREGGARGARRQPRPGRGRPERPRGALRRPHRFHFNGQAWLPPALPAGVSGSDIQ